MRKIAQFVIRNAAYSFIIYTVKVILYFLKFGTPNMFCHRGKLFFLCDSDICFFKTYVGANHNINFRYMLQGRDNIFQELIKKF